MHKLYHEIHIQELRTDILKACNTSGIPLSYNTSECALGGVHQYKE